MKTLKKFFIIAAFACLAPVFAEAQEIDERLLGVWQLDSVELTVNHVSQKFALSTLLEDKSKLPRNMFTMLYIFDERIGVHSTETEFVPPENVSFKGSLTTENGTMVISMDEEEERTFTYNVEDERLEIRYTSEDTEFFLVYKLAFQYVKP